MAEFIYQEPFPLSEDTTEYRLLTKDYVKTVECDGRRILKVAPEGLELLAREAIADVSFYLRASHLQKLTRILDDPEATDNDKFVAYTMLLNQAVAARGRVADLSGYRYGHRDRQEGRGRLYGLQRRRDALEGYLRDIPRPQPALFPGRSVHDDRGKEHRHEPSGPDSTCTRLRVMRTASCSSPREGARPTRRSCTSRPRRF